MTSAYHDVMVTTSKVRNDVGVKKLIVPQIINLIIKVIYRLKRATANFRYCQSPMF